MATKCRRYTAAAAVGPSTSRSARNAVGSKGTEDSSDPYLMAKPPVAVQSGPQSGKSLALVGAMIPSVGFAFMGTSRGSIL